MTHPAPALRADAVDYLTRAQAAADLRSIREQWGDLLTAIEHPPATEWPPRETNGFLDQLAARLAEPDEDDEEPNAPSIGRMPLVLREHPAPLNLDPLDAAISVERDLFELADQIAEQVQRPIRRRLAPSQPLGRALRWEQDPADRRNPARWHLPTHSASVTGRAASPGSRAYGLHWAAVWIEGRVMDEDTGGPDPLFRPLPEHLLHEAARTARSAVQRIRRALGHDPRNTPLDRPCPWCGGQLVGHTEPDTVPAITCETGEACTAPVLLNERGRRVWRGHELAGLWAALAAREEAAA